MRTIVAIVAVTFSLYLCGCEQNPPPLTPEQKLIGRAEDAVRNGLKDPNSATFKDEFASVERHCVVGKVLAKNGFGAFAGYNGFVWNGGFVLDQDTFGLFKYVDASTKCLTG